MTHPLRLLGLASVAVLVIATPSAAQDDTSLFYDLVCVDGEGQAPGTRLLWFVGIALLLFVATFVGMESLRKVESPEGAQLSWRERRRIRRAEARQQSAGDFLMSIPERWVRIYIPLAIIVFVLLFPFYWMAITAVKPDEQLVNFDTVNPYWVEGATMKHIHALLCETNYDQWMWNTMLVAIVATFLSLVASVFAAYAIVRLRYKGSQSVGGAIFLAYLVPPSILFIPLSTMLSSYEVGGYKLWDTQWALILTYPTILIPFSTWLLMGYFKSIPFELEECALIDGATRWQILRKIVLPLAGPGLISGGDLRVHRCAGTSSSMRSPSSRRLRTRPFRWRSCRRWWTGMSIDGAR